MHATFLSPKWIIKLSFLSMKVKFVYFSIFILKIFEKKLRKIISLCIYFSFGQMNFRNFGQKKTDLLLGLTHIHTRPQQNWGYAKSYGFSNLVSEESIPLPPPLSLCDLEDCPTFFYLLNLMLLSLSTKLLKKWKGTEVHNVH